MINRETTEYLMRDQEKQNYKIDYSYDIYRNTELYNNFKSINLYELITRKSAVVLWGNGYRITTKNKLINQIFAKWEKNNNLLNLFFKVERELSARGGAGVLIDPNGNGDLIFTIAQPWNTNQFSLSQTGDVILANVWTITRYDNISLWMISTYTDKEIKRWYKTKDDNVASAGQASVKMNSRYIFPNYVKIDIGEVPAQWFDNLPKANVLGVPLGGAYPDWTALKNLQAQLDNVFECMWKEVNYNRTRVFGNFTQKEMLELIKNADPRAQWDRKRLLDIEDDLFIQAQIGGIEGQKKIEVLQGDPKLDQYIRAINDIIDLAFLSCGYSGLKDSNSVKTTSEIQYNMGNETQITNLKKIIRQKQWKKLFDKALLMEGIQKEALDDYIFEIKDNQLKFDRDQLENQLLLEDAGLISRVEMAQNVFGLNENEATDYLEKIKTHRDKYGSTKDEQMNKLMSDNSENKDDTIKQDAN